MVNEHTQASITDTIKPEWEIGNVESNSLGVCVEENESMNELAHTSKNETYGCRQKSCHQMQS